MSAFLITSWTCVMTFGGGLIALRLEGYRAFVLAFAAGALVASALMDVIPDALELLIRSGVPLHHHHLMFAASIGFLSFYLIERSTHSDVESHRATSHGRHQAGLWGAGGIGIHSLLDGVAIGEAFSAGAAVGWNVAMAVTPHKIAAGGGTGGGLPGPRR